MKLRVEDVQGRNCLTQFHVSGGDAVLGRSIGAHMERASRSLVVAG